MTAKEIKKMTAIYDAIDNLIDVAEIDRSRASRFRKETMELIVKASGEGETIRNRSISFDTKGNSSSQMPKSIAQKYDEDCSDEYDEDCPDEYDEDCSEGESESLQSQLLKKLMACGISGGFGYVDNNGKLVLKTNMSGENIEGMIKSLFNQE